MASYFKTIADAARTVAAAQSGAPALCEVRDTDVVHPRDVVPCLIVTMGGEQEIGAASGAGTSTDQGDRLMAYQLGFTEYRHRPGTNSTDLSLNQDFILLAQQALNKTTLTGATTVYGTKLVRRDAWEHQPFGQGWEVSRWGMIFWSSEPRLG